MKKALLIYLSVSLTLLVTAAPPTNYYLSAEGQTTAALKTALFNIIKDPSVTSYNGLWTAFQSTDRRADGKVWDMYSNCNFTFVTDQDGGSGGTIECQKYNREHSFPKSWFNDASPMYSDLFHLYPTDKLVNNKRDNYAYGVVGTATWTSANGSKLGTSSVSGYSGTVFEPIAEYKGDFARSYFYMATCYQNITSGWSSPHFVSGSATYPTLNTWSINMLLQWHRDDPVSAKEIARNDAVYNVQSNRNPFIDFPELAEYIWGNRMGQAWHTTTLVDESVLAALALYPNPAVDYVIVEAATIRPIAYEVYTIAGVRMHSGITENNGTIDVSSLNDGVYIISLTIDEQRVQRRIVVTR